MPHEQVIVKVNAAVDRGIAPLVRALNESPDVLTVSSCEGDDWQEAYVAFAVRDGWRDVGQFVERLSAALGKDAVARDLPFKLSVEWYAGGGTPTGYLRVPRRHVKDLAESVRRALAGPPAGQVVVP